MSNNETEEIDKDSNDEINKDDFSKFFEQPSEEIIVEAEEEADEYQGEVDDDLIYEIDLYNSLIGDLSLSQQNNPKIQEKYLKFARSIIDLKNKAKTVNLDDIEDYQDMKKIYNNEFNVEWIIPISLDKKKIYKKLDIANSDTNDTVMDEYIEMASSKGIQYEDFFEELQKEVQYIDEFNRDKISLKTFRKMMFDIEQCYIIKKDLNKKDVGYEIYLNQFTQLLRYFNIENKFWQNYINFGPEQFTYEEKDENKKIIGSRVAQILPGSYTNIIGFLVLGSNQNGILDALQGEKWFERIRKTGEATKIKKNENAIVTMKNHGIKEGDKIMILKSNCEPSIDGEYTSGIKVINDDEFMVPVNLSEGKDGDYAEVYTTTSLQFKKIELPKRILEEGNKDDFGSAYEDNSTLYLFPEEQINEEEYKQIVKKVIPSADAIIKSQMDEIKNINTVNEIDRILKKFSLEFRELGYDNYVTLTNLLDEKYFTEENNSKKFDSNKFYEEIMKMREKIIGEKNSEKVADDIIFGDKYILNKDVIKYYGNYPNVGNDVDSLATRYNWVLSTPDYGEYYFLFVEYQKIQEMKGEEISVKDISTRITEIKKTISEIEKDLKVISNNKNCANRLIDPVKTYNSYDDLYKDGCNINFLKGDWAVIKSSKSHENNMIYQWNGTNWEQNSLIRSLDDLCLLGVEKIVDFDLEKLHCLFREACKNKKQVRLEKRLERKNGELKLLQSFSDESAKEIEKKVKDNIKVAELNLQIYLRERVDTRTKETIEMYERDIDPIYKEILKVPDLQNKEYLRNLLIKKDGIIINKDIYSIRTGKMICCAHYWYQMKIAEGGSPEYSEKMRREMLAIFAAEEENGMIFCNHDGKPLDLMEYDTAEGLSKTTGEVDRQRQVVLSEEEQLKEEIITLQEQEKEAEIFECNSPEIRNELLKMGFKAEQIANAKDICAKVNTINSKTGILIKKKDFINIIVDVLQSLLKLPDFTRFKKIQLEEFKRKGIDLKTVDPKIFAERHHNLIMLRKITLIAARLLITYQTMIPPQTPTGSRTSVIFEGFDRFKGNEYMSLLIEESKTLPIQRMTKNGKKVIEYLQLGKIKEEVKKSYDELSEMASVKKLKRDRQLYDTKKVKVEEKKDQIIIREVPKVEKLPENYKKEVEKAKTFQQFYNFQKELRGRQSYIAQEIIKAVNETIANAQDKESDDPKSKIGSCCFEEVSPNINYYTYVKEKTLKNVDELLRESRENAFYTQLFLNGGVIMKHFFKKDANFHISVRNVGYDNSELRKKLFLTYVSKGIFKGERHEFKDGICLITGESEEDIKKTEYTVVEENELFQVIIRKTLKKLVLGGSEQDINEMKERDEDLIDHFDFEKYKEESHESLMKEVNTFVEKIGKLLNRSNENQKLRDRIENLGFLEKVLNSERNRLEDDPNTSPLDIINFENERSRMRINNLKRYINNYFRRYISTVSNMFNPAENIKQIMDMEEEKSRELQKYIYDREYFLTKYLVKRDAEIFKKLRFDVSAKVIMNISADTDKWDKTYSKIEKEVNFNLGHLGDVLLYILIKNLNQFISMEFEKGSVDKNRIIAQFIMEIFEQIFKDSDALDYTRDTFLEGDYRRVAVNETKDVGKVQKDYAGRVKVDREDDYEAVYDEMAEQEKMDRMKEKFIKEYKDKHDSDPTDNEIIDFIEEQEREGQLDKEEEDEEWMGSKIDAEGDDVIEIGDGYGEMPQGGEGGEEGDF